MQNLEVALTHVLRIAVMKRAHVNLHVSLCVRVWCYCQSVAGRADGECLSLSVCMFRVCNVHFSAETYRAALGTHARLNLSQCVASGTRDPFLAGNGTCPSMLSPSG